MCAPLTFTELRKELPNKLSTVDEKNKGKERKENITSNVFDFISIQYLHYSILPTSKLLSAKSEKLFSFYYCPCFTYVHIDV